MSQRSYTKKKIEYARTKFLILGILSIYLSFSCASKLNGSKERIIQNDCYIGIDEDEFYDIFGLLHFNELRTWEGKIRITVYRGKTVIPKYFLDDDYILEADGCRPKKGWDMIEGGENHFAYIPKYLFPFAASLPEVKKYIKEIHIERNNKKMVIQTADLKD